MKNKKDFVTERFNAALILGAALLTLVVVCEISFLRTRIATQLDLRTRTAITLLKNTDESLFSELEILKENILSLDARHEAAQSELYADLIRNVVKSSHRFDAIFYLRARGAKQESLAHFSSDARISDLGEIRLADIASELKKEEWVSRYMMMDGAWRYFLIKRVNADSYLLGFANTARPIARLS